MHFGIHLVQSGAIDADSFCTALDRQITERPPLGQLAMEDGYLSARQVRDVLRHQNASDDQRFGEAAKELGLLTREQIATLLYSQSERQRPIAEHLIELGVLTPLAAQQALKRFRNGVIGFDTNGESNELLTMA